MHLLVKHISFSLHLYCKIIHFSVMYMYIPGYDSNLCDTL